MIKFHCEKKSWVSFKDEPYIGVKLIITPYYFRINCFSLKKVDECFKYNIDLENLFGFIEVQLSL